MPALLVPGVRRNREEGPKSTRTGLEVRLLVAVLEVASVVAGRDRAASAARGTGEDRARMRELPLPDVGVPLALLGVAADAERRGGVSGPKGREVRLLLELRK